MTRVIEQPDTVATAVNAALHFVVNEEDQLSRGTPQLFAHRFSVQRDGWALFTYRMGGVGDYLVNGNCDGKTLDLDSDEVCSLR